MNRETVIQAGVEMLERTGALQFQIRHQDDEEPTVWIAVARYNRAPDGHPRPAGEPGEEAWECAASLDPVRAVLRLCETVIDGGVCKHCGRPAGLSEDFDEMPLDALVCWYQLDPELGRFRRGCEGST